MNPKNNMTDTVVARASQALLGTKQQATSSPSSSRSTDTTSVNMYILDKAFYRILENYGMPNEPVTFHTILVYLRKYIMSRKLFDCSKGDVILCNGDPLGSLFKRISFTTREAADLIKRHISPVFAQMLHNVGQIKSTVSDSDIKVLEGVSDDDKVTNCFSSSDDEDLDGNSELDVEIAFNDSSSEDNLSIFEEFRDNKNISKSFASSDTLDTTLEEFDSASICSFKTEYNEFEPFSEVDSDDDLLSFSSDSDLEIHIVEEKYTVERIGFTDEDDFFADSSDTDNSSARGETSVVNPWFCKCVSNEAKARNGFCHNCWTAQFGWRKEEERRVPPRVLRNKRKCTTGRNDHVDQLPAKMLKPSSPEACDRQLASSPVTEPEEPFSQGQLSTSTDSGSLDMLGTCMMCESRPRNTAIVHGRSAHIVGCYKCSRKVQEKNLKCPQCRRVVERVVRLFV